MAWTLTVPAGATESEIRKLGHWRLNAVLSPASPKVVKATLLGSIDGDNFHPVFGTGDSTWLVSDPAFLQLEPAMWQFPAIIQLVLSEPTKQELIFNFGIEDKG